MRKYLVLIVMVLSMKSQASTPRLWIDDAKWLANINQSNLDDKTKEEWLNSMFEKGVGKVQFLGAYPPLQPLSCLANGYNTADTNECVPVPGLSGTWNLKQCRIVCVATSVSYWCEDAVPCT